MFFLNPVELNCVVLSVLGNIRYDQHIHIHTQTAHRHSLPKSMKVMVFDEKVRFMLVCVCVGAMDIPFLAVTQEQR